MLIPTKFNGYQAGIRLYPSGGGSGGPPAPQNSWEAMAPGMFKDTSNTSNTSTSNTSQFTVDQKSQQPPSHSIYNPQYNNYANPLTAGSISNYGTMQGPSAGYMAAMAPGGQGLGNYYQSLQQFGAQQGSQPYGMNYATFNPAQKAMGASQGDLMAAYSYNPMQGAGYGGYGGMPQMQTPFNPYTNRYQSPFSYGGGQQLPQNMYGGVYGGMGGAPAFFNYAEGGITSLLDNDE